jgi:hypothetical protein
MVKKNWTLTQEAFDKLLSWLHPDREEAGRRYEDIRCKLIRYFLSRGLSEAEEFADETINRVAQKIDVITKEFTGDPVYYFYGVARSVLRRFYKEAA